MLQQTQVNRVLPKYREFIKQYPGFKALANAELKNVLFLWQGLGYNRRARNLRETARIIVADWQSKLPDLYEDLITLPGIGDYTARALQAFVYKKAVPVIDTNIRRVYLFTFFSGQENVQDKELIPYIEKSIDRDDPKEWYYALMDYGSFLGKAEKGINKISKHYSKQSRFEGSNRQIRGEIIRQLLAGDELDAKQISAKSGYEYKRVMLCLDSLVSEKMIILNSGIYKIIAD
jgi:A/G-specific adenine glycosylase